MTGPIQQSLIDRLKPVISDERLGTYLIAAGFDADRALKLYVWNAQVGEAFHLPIQAVEVGLRNRVNTALIHRFGEEWWSNEAFRAAADQERLENLRLVERRIRNRRLKLSNGQVVAGLSFGFWVGLLHKRYNPALWGGKPHGYFPGLPAGRSRDSLATAVSRVAFIRNRIWHHEPIIKLDLSTEHATVLQALEWICPVKAEWVRPHCRVPTLLRQKP